MDALRYGPVELYALAVGGLALACLVILVVGSIPDLVEAYSMFRAWRAKRAAAIESQARAFSLYEPGFDGDAA